MYIDYFYFLTGTWGGPQARFSRKKKFNEKHGNIHRLIQFFILISNVSRNLWLQLHRTKIWTQKDQVLCFFYAKNFSILAISFFGRNIFVKFFHNSITPICRKFFCKYLIVAHLPLRSAGHCVKAYFFGNNIFLLGFLLLSDSQV